MSLSWRCDVVKNMGDFLKNFGLKERSDLSVKIQVGIKSNPAFWKARRSKIKSISKSKVY